MKTLNVLQHGGNIAYASQVYGEPVDHWLDLSTGISPFSYPVDTLSDEAWTRLPGDNEEKQLLAAARLSYGIPHAASIVMAPGTQVLIQQLPHMFTTSTVVVKSPTYGEHAHCWKLAGHKVEETQFTELPANANIVVVVNPNNPDGHLFPIETLKYWAAKMAERGGYLIVDEAFADVTPDFSLGNSATLPGLIILRSFGKFFGLAGLRLGFAICSTSIASKLSAALGPWAVSGPALEIGARALADLTWQENTRDKLATASLRLDQLLSHYSLNVIGGTNLFRLIEHDHATALYEHLARQGILTRPFDYQPRWLRLGIPAQTVDWDRLETALKVYSQ